MKLRLAAVCATLFSVCVLTAVAGTPSPASGVKIETVPNAVAAPGANVENSAVGSSISNVSSSGGASSSDAGGSSSTGTASSNGSGPSAYGISPGGTKDSNQVSTEIAREKVIDTGDKAVETEKTTKTESKDKTFTPRLLDTVSDISAVGAQEEHSSASKADKNKSAAAQDKNDSHKPDWI